MLEDYDLGVFYETTQDCLRYIQEAGLRGNPLELAFIKLQILEGKFEAPDVLLEAIDGCVNLAVHHAITTLLYRARRHKFNSDHCRNLVEVINLLAPAFTGYTQEDFEYFLYGEELKQGTYWSDLTNDYDQQWRPGERKLSATDGKKSIGKEEASSSSSSTASSSSKSAVATRRGDLFYDSDEEEEISVRGKSDRPMPTHRHYAKDFEPHPEVVREWLGEYHKLPVLNEIEKEIRLDYSKEVFKNSFIHHPHPVRDAQSKKMKAQILADIEAANKILIDVEFGECSVDEACMLIRDLKTQFALAQYRGIAYNTTTFNALARQRSLEAVEVGKTVYASAVFSACETSPAEYYAGGTSPKEVEALEVEARKLKQLLKDKHNSGPIVIDGVKYDNQALALHDFYTNNYDAFGEELKKYITYKEQGGKTEVDAKFVPPIWAAFEGLTTNKIPFVSSGDVPQHALRYAYGSKYYPGHQDDRLRPRWRKCGKAEFPYSGKVYAALFSLDEYLLEEPHHVPSLNAKGKLWIRPDIVGELETCFAASLPANRILCEHVARYPSFPCAFKDRNEPEYKNKGYREKYLYKYGLTKAEYEIFWELISEAAPHTEASKTVKVSLGNWLIHYHEVRLVEMARRLADRRRLVLVYRDSKTGLLTPDLEPLKPIQHATLVDFVRSGAEAFTEKSCVSNTLDFSMDKLPLSVAIPQEGREVLAPVDGLKLLDKATVNVYKRYEQLLTESLKKTFVLHPTPTDGNAPFHAVAEALKLANKFGGKYTHAELRKKAAKYVCNTNYSFTADTEHDERNKARREQYWKEMSEPAIHPSMPECWGSDLELDAIAKELGIRIRLYSTSYVLLTFVSSASKIEVQVAKLMEIIRNTKSEEEWLAAQMRLLGCAGLLKERGINEEGAPKFLEFFIRDCGAAFEGLPGPSQFLALCCDSQIHKVLVAKGSDILPPTDTYKGGKGKGFLKKLEAEKGREVKRQAVKLQDAMRQVAKLQDAKLQVANVQEAELQEAKLKDAMLRDAKPVEYLGLLAELEEAKKVEEAEYKDHINSTRDFRRNPCYFDFSPDKRSLSESSGKQPLESDGPEPDVILYHTAGTHFFFLRRR